MTLEEMKQKVYVLIEEYSEDAEDLTEDEDLALKMNSVINSVMHEVARMKKIPARATMEITFAEGEEEYEIELTDIDSQIYQIDVIKGVDSIVLGNNVVFEEEGTAKIYYYKYPVAITEDTDDDYVFELDNDALECMVYGVAGDLLKADISQSNGNIYMQRYEQMLARLDPRRGLGGIYIDGATGI
jgi:hypothetical protein